MNQINISKCVEYIDNLVNDYGNQLDIFCWNMIKDKIIEINPELFPETVFPISID